MAYKNIGSLHPRRINQWFSDVKYAADVDAMHGTFRANLAAGTGLIAAGASTNIISGVAASGASGNSTLASAYQVDADYGRCLQVNGTVGATTGNTSNVTLYGLDYLGQPMAEQITQNGTATVTTKKAFKWLLSFTWGDTSAGLLSIGTANSLGLPYRTLRIVADFINASSAASAGSITAGIPIGIASSATNPMAITSADPRGTYTPCSPSLSPNGSRLFELICTADILQNQFPVNTIYGPQHVTA